MAEKERVCMVRGCEKRIYYVKNPESELFDEAYLVLRRGAATTAGADLRDIELEAMRILRGSDRSSASARKRQGNMRAFFAGAAMSALLTGAAAILAWLIL